MIDGIFEALTFRYAVLTSSPQNPVPQRTPPTLYLGFEQKAARKEEDQLSIPSREFDSSRDNASNSDGKAYRLEFKLTGPRSYRPNTRYNRRVPSRVPDFRAPYRRNAA